MSVYWPLSVLCVFVLSVWVWVCACAVYVYVISNQSTSRKTHVSDHCNPDALLHKTHIKVLRLDMCTSMISLSKIAHQIYIKSVLKCTSTTKDFPVSQTNHKKHMKAVK